MTRKKRTRPVDYLRNAKFFAKFCKKFDKEFGCRKVLGCHILCPLYWFREIAILMDNRNVTFSEAWRIVERRGLTKDEGRQILEEVFNMSLEQIRELFQSIRGEDNE